eukprot:2928469-Pleurochrysis_carterae.AAC.2
MLFVRRHSSSGAAAAAESRATCVAYVQGLDGCTTGAQQHVFALVNMRAVLASPALSGMPTCESAYIYNAHPPVHTT